MVMGESHDFRNVTHFTAGAIGDPGDRVFFLQVGDEFTVVSVRLEKQQVRALAQFLRSVLDDMPSPDLSDPPSPVPLREPTVAEWVVGQIAVGVAEADAEVVVVVDELVPDEDGEEAEVDPFDESPPAGRIRAHINAAQAAGFIATSDDLMSKGRPPCRLCGQPEDPSGHACPRLN